MNSAIDLVTQIQAKLVAAKAEGVDKTKIQGDIKQLQGQLTSIVDAASFSGENWLTGDATAAPTTKSVLGSFVRDSSGDVSVKTIDYTLDNTTILVDTTAGATKNGILDKQYTVTPNTITLNVNTDGTVASATVQSYSQDFLTGAGATFDANGLHANEGGNDYVKTQGTWVKAIDVAGTNQEVVANDTVTSWGVDTANGGAAVTAPASILSMDITGGTFDLDSMIKGADAALKAMTGAAASLGSISSRIDLQTDFVSKLSDSIDSGVGKLVDADMEEESSKLTALQTQQQLAVQSLSIANSASQNILTLFRG
jgi:flagellin